MIDRPARIWPLVLAVAATVVLCVTVLALCVPQLPLPALYRPDVRVPVPVVGPSHIPIPR